MSKSFWVFGYGSLLWNPGFEVAERRPALLRDFRRSFCMRSIHHRGTPERPGLVLALDSERGALCRGVALKSASAGAETALKRLRERELISYAYKEVIVSLELDDGQTLEAITYVVDRQHSQYCEQLSLSRQASMIAKASGKRGTNRDYLRNTVAKFQELGICDNELAMLHELVEQRA